MSGPEDLDDLFPGLGLDKMPKNEMDLEIMALVPDAKLYSRGMSPTDGKYYLFSFDAKPIFFTRDVTFMTDFGLVEVARSHGIKQIACEYYLDGSYKTRLEYRI